MALQVGVGVAGEFYVTDSHYLSWDVIMVDAAIRVEPFCAVVVEIQTHIIHDPPCFHVYHIVVVLYEHGTVSHDSVREVLGVTIAIFAWVTKHLLPRDPGFLR